MKDYKWKPSKRMSDHPIAPATNTTKKKATTGHQNKEIKNRLDAFHALKREHPLVYLNVGTLRANVRRAYEGQNDDARDTIDHLKMAVRQASETKRTCQLLIGRYIEKIFNGELNDGDRDILNSICPPISSFDDDEINLSSESLNEEKTDRDDKSSHFISALMNHIYTGNPTMNKDAKAFIERVKALHLWNEGRSERNTRVKSEYASSSLLRSVAIQLATELRQIFIQGSRDLAKKVLESVLPLKV